HAFYRALPEEDRLSLKEDVRLNSWAERFIAKVSDGSLVSLVAKVDGEIVGEGSLYRTFHGWTRHVGEVRVSVAPAYRRHGLGRRLTLGLLKIAKDLGIEKVLLRIVETQQPARQIALHLGFQQEAVLQRHVVDLAGHKHDLRILSLEMDQLGPVTEMLSK
ncbi:MAG: GNAT family N-acetyltransferase, partial [Firmicutes bacterium]|nr:GNAT family N-acetyltransferase [Bacillota bacterium]